jgi:hypothetical protein
MTLGDLNHTKGFFQGYRNGSEAILYTQGYVAGCNHIATHGYKNHVPSYKYGYEDGLKYASYKFSYCTLPAQTNDNYLDYYIGFHDGRIGEKTISKGDYSKGESFDQGPGCPVGHSQEYCTGYKGGWSTEFNQEAE